MKAISIVSFGLYSVQALATSQLTPIPFDFDKMIQLAEDAGENKIAKEPGVGISIFYASVDASVDELSLVEKNVLKMAPRSLSFSRLFTVHLQESIKDGFNKAIDRVSCNVNYGKALYSSTQDENSPVLHTYFEIIPAYNVYNISEITLEMHKVCFDYMKANLDDQYVGIRNFHNGSNLIEVE